jgi:hypothetical protein
MRRPQESNAETPPPTPPGFAQIVSDYFPVLHLRSGEIRILNSGGNIERVIPFHDTNRKL